MTLGRHGAVGHGPAGDVHLMHALVADLAVAEIPEPVPVVMDEVLVIRLLRRRAEPEVEVQLLGRLLRRLEADAPPRLAGVAVGDQQLAVLAAADRGHLFGPTRDRSGSACRAARCGRTSARPRRACGPRRCCGCTASRRTRPCPPGRPRWPAASANGWARRSRRRPDPCRPGSLRRSCTHLGVLPPRFFTISLREANSRLSGSTR